MIKMAKQDSPLWERLGIDYDLCPHWTLFNMVMALNLRLLIIPPEQRPSERGKALLMVNNRATYQRQSWIPESLTGEQVLFTPVAEHKLYFNLCIISLMFLWDPGDCTTWDVCEADQPSICNIDQGMCDALKVPITIVSNADIAYSTTHWTGQWQYRVSYATWRELTEEGKVFKDILQRIKFPARFEEAMPPKCEIICMWYEGTKRTLTYVIFNGEYPRAQLDHSFFYS